MLYGLPIGEILIANIRHSEKITGIFFYCSAMQDCENAFKCCFCLFINKYCSLYFFLNIGVL